MEQWRADKPELEGFIAALSSSRDMMRQEHQRLTADMAAAAARRLDSGLPGVTTHTRPGLKLSPLASNRQSRSHWSYYPLECSERNNEPVVTEMADSTNVSHTLACAYALYGVHLLAPLSANAWTPLRKPGMSTGLDAGHPWLQPHCIQVRPGWQSLAGERSAGRAKQVPGRPGRD